ncbi:pantetheine-phosphate adenylyltransferase [Leptotrichia wadei]|jgi:pantetheine-phosphate adenylyltransferase|uniref:Phosphopantetheine adenylyltransferase n=2 Tax=Leptotrichia wadei TaxID=157687 RepID=A0A133ZXI3_9FUSO|nr:pantetheine-phosphate adenylyltransferase [Leptotrichia wadei]ERK48679.1 pantetheine-phosphate adenylyltransferase [Leptotrichia wadei F0279]KXB60131.1 pantetheine-phosphate adenylyltransferase [Leptotrichia wadei]BBM42865.1 pantetheine-phosphate adenylyltransferase [Leptotrichia wadei]BBM47588.1 pantetheine-phosphate adenylyltransferase [Leptotrichia wadei]BBM49890.1 pantetheine-phosphate adenylyltransferase [Leptotrichia wadei]
MEKIALYPGSFDPITKGHIDIIKRSSNLFDKLIIGIFKNSTKSKAWFSDEEKVEMIQEILKKEGIKAEIKIFNGLLVDFMYKENVNILIRGLRALSDYEYELQFTLTNKTLAKSEFETVFLTASREYLYLSSSLVKEVALNRGDLSFFVTENVERRLIDKVEK